MPSDLASMKRTTAFLNPSNGQFDLRDLIRGCRIVQISDSEGWATHRKESVSLSFAEATVASTYICHRQQGSHCEGTSRENIVRTL